jgi:hypothetical protein
MPQGLEIFLGLIRILLMLALIHRTSANCPVTVLLAVSIKAYLPFYITLSSVLVTSHTEQSLGEFHRRCRPA